MHARRMAETERSRVGLVDGRVLDVQVSGPPDGVPFLWHHGTPGCSFQPRARQRAIAEHGMRLITYTRPGGLGSTRAPRRCVVDTAADVEAIAGHLGLDSFVTGGASGGGPHALATAARLPDRVLAVLLVGSLKPFRDEPDYAVGLGADDAESTRLAAHGDLALWPFLEAKQADVLAMTPEALIEGLAAISPQADRAVLTRELGEDLLSGLQGGAEQLHGWLDDALAFVAHWGFDVDDLAVPSYLWHGSEDPLVPFHHGEWLAARLPGVVAHLEEGEGHLSMAVAAFPRMLDEIARHLRW